MRGKVYTIHDVRRAIHAMAVYASDLGPDGELPPVLDKDLQIYARTALQILSAGPDNDRRLRISHDWKRRLELIGLDPQSFQIMDGKEFEAAVNIMNFTRRQREAVKDKRRQLRGPTKGYYAKGERGSVPYVPPSPQNGAPWLKAASSPVVSEPVDQRFPPLPLEDLGSDDPDLPE
jgi:hypothetical protein